MSSYSVADVGGFDVWDETGKRFVEKDVATRFIGMSVNSTRPGEGSAFWHAHAKLEELYIVLDGQGEIALDDEVVPLTAGTTVRVGPGVWHALRALPDSPVPMRWLCVRSGGEALREIGHDAERDSERPFPWNA